MALATEHLPRLAAAGLGGVVVLVIAMAWIRDPASVALAEPGAASGEATTSARVVVPEVTRDGDRPKRSIDNSAPAASSAKPIPTLDEAVIAKANSVAQLQALEKQAPDDPRVLKKLARAHALLPDGLIDALLAAKKLFVVDPKLLEDKEMQQIVLRAATGTPAQQDIAFPMLTTGMGTVGPDLIYDMSTASSVTGQTKTKVLELTKDPEIRSIASPALRVTLELRDRSPCERKPFFADAEKHGDRRTLGFLTPLALKSGCNVFGMGDCYECLGNRAELTKAITAINTRLKAQNK